MRAGFQLSLPSNQRNSKVEEKISSIIKINEPLLGSFIYFGGEEKDFWRMTYKEVYNFIENRQKRQIDDNKYFSIAVEQAIINQVQKRTKRLDVFSNVIENEEKFESVEDKEKYLDELYKKFGRKGRK